MLSIYSGCVFTTHFNQTHNKGGWWRFITAPPPQYIVYYFCRITVYLNFGKSKLFADRLDLNGSRLVEAGRTRRDVLRSALRSGVKSQLSDSEERLMPDRDLIYCWDVGLTSACLCLLNQLFTTIQLLALFLLLRNSRLALFCSSIKIKQRALIISMHKTGATTEFFLRHNYFSSKSYVF